MQAIIEGNLYEIEPAVKVILDRLMTENAELKRENKRLEEAYQKATSTIAATNCVECKRDAETVKHGHWIRRTSEHLPITRLQHCSECGHKTDYDFPYCSNCGAKMDLKDGESE